MNKLIRVLWIVLILCVPAAHAGRPCVEVQPEARTTMRAMELAYKTRTVLDTSNAQVALIARVGQDLSKYHLRYSHIGYVWRDHPNGRWLVVHQLNHCGTAESALYNEGLGNFFLDDLFAFEALILIPAPETQQRLAQLLTSEMPKRLYSPRYNMVAYAFSTMYQNSNQWALEMLAAASATDTLIDQREQAQAWLKLVGYRPSTVSIPAMTRLGGRMFHANIAFDDHPFDRRMAGMIDTVTVDSIAQFLEKRDSQLRRVTISID